LEYSKDSPELHEEVLYQSTNPTTKEVTAARKFKVNLQGKRLSQEQEKFLTSLGFDIYAEKSFQALIRKSLTDGKDFIETVNDHLPQR